jgi:hypothetical protein
VNNKQLLDSYVEKNYQHLMDISSGCCSTLYYRRREASTELLHHCLVEIYENLEKKNSFCRSEVDFLKYIKTYMKLKLRWERSMSWSRKRDFTLQTYRPHTGDGHDALVLCNIPVSEETIYLDAENTDDNTKDFLRDLMLNNISVERGLQFYELVRVMEGNLLTTAEKEIFHNHFLDGRSGRKIFHDRQMAGDSTKNYKDTLKEIESLRKKIVRLLEK